MGNKAEQRNLAKLEVKKRADRRAVMWPLAGGIVNLAITLGSAKGLLNWVPNWIVSILFIASLFPVIYWAWTHERLILHRAELREKLREGWNTKPIQTAVWGVVIGVFALSVGYTLVRAGKTFIFSHSQTNAVVASPDGPSGRETQSQPISDTASANTLAAPASQTQQAQTGKTTQDSETVKQIEQDKRKRAAHAKEEAAKWYRALDSLATEYLQSHPGEVIKTGKPHEYQFSPSAVKWINQGLGEQGQPLMRTKKVAVAPVPAIKLRGNAKFISHDSTWNGFEEIIDASENSTAEVDGGKIISPKGDEKALVPHK